MVKIISTLKRSQIFSHVVKLLQDVEKRNVQYTWVNRK